jgi:hypothetical protein
LNGTVLGTDGTAAYAIGLTNGQQLLDEANADLVTWAGTSINEADMVSRVIFVNGNGIVDHEIESWKELTSLNPNRAGIFVLECPDNEGKYILVNDDRARALREDGTLLRGLQDTADEYAAGNLPRTPEMGAQSAMFAGINAKQNGGR